MQWRKAVGRSLVGLTVVLAACDDDPTQVRHPGLRSGPALSMEAGSTIAGSGNITFTTITPVSGVQVTSSAQSFSYSRTIASNGWASMPDVSSSASADSMAIQIPKVLASLPDANTISSGWTDTVLVYTDSGGAEIKLIYSQAQFESPYYPCYDEVCPIAQIKEYRNDVLVTHHRMRWKYSTSGGGYVLHRSELIAYDSLTGSHIGTATASLTPSTFTSVRDPGLELDSRGFTRRQSLQYAIDRTLNSVSTELGELILPKELHAQMMGAGCALATITAVQAYKKFRCKLDEYRQSGGDPEKFDELREAAGDAALAAGAAVLACTVEAGSNM